MDNKSSVENLIFYFFDDLKITDFNCEKRYLQTIKIFNEILIKHMNVI